MPSVNKNLAHSNPLNTAVLFLVFNRIDTTRQVFEAIRQAKPPRLYIASDGPRQNIKDEEKKVEEVRTYVLNNIDWSCEVKTLLREKNLGCKYAVSSAIDWFFENEEMGIILEDDCLPSQSFFRYCEELLLKYRCDKRILHIGGTNPIDNVNISNTYYFSNYNRIWGWASWRRAWKYNDVDLKLWEEVKEMKILFLLFSTKEAVFWKRNIENALIGSLDTWDYQWFLCRILQGYAIIPNVNLVSNIGFNQDATHTKDSRNGLSNLKRGEISFPLTHPKFIIRDIERDNTWSKIITRNIFFFNPFNSFLLCAIKKKQ